MKKHNASKVVLITILVFLLLTWILPAAYYSGEYVDQGRTQMGLFDLLNYPITSLSYFGYIALFLVLVGGFYGVLYKIPAYRNFLDKIVEKVEGKEKIVLALLSVLIAAFVSVCGAHVAIALFIPFVISLVLLMGYDKIVAALVTVGSISAGLIGSTYAGSNLDILLSTLAIKSDFQIWVRFAMLIVALAVVIFNEIWYIKHHDSDVKIASKPAKENEKEVVVAHTVEVSKEVVKKSTTKSAKAAKKTGRKTSSKSRRSDNKAALKEEEVIIVKETLKEDSYVPTVTTEKHSIWPIAVIFGLLFILFVLAFIPWTTLNVNVFTEATDAVKKFELFGFPIFAKVLGSFNAFGKWSITDLFLPMALTLLLLTLIYNVSFKDAWDGFVGGVKEALAPAVIVILLYAVLVEVTYHPFQLPIYKVILGWAKGFNIATTSLVAFLSGFFNSDIAYSFQSVLPYYTSVVTSSKNYELVGIIFQSMYGLAMLVVPTSLALMGTLAYLKVSYKDWLKNSWKLLLELFVLLLILFIVLILI